MFIGWSVTSHGPRCLGDERIPEQVRGWPLGSTLTSDVTEDDSGRCLRPPPASSVGDVQGVQPQPRWAQARAPVTASPLSSGAAAKGQLGAEKAWGS